MNEFNENGVVNTEVETNEITTTVVETKKTNSSTIVKAIGLGVALGTVVAVACKDKIANYRDKKEMKRLEKRGFVVTQTKELKDNTEIKSEVTEETK